MDGLNDLDRNTVLNPFTFSSESSACPPESGWAGDFEFRCKNSGTLMPSELIINDYVMPDGSGKGPETTPWIAPTTTTTTTTTTTASTTTTAPKTRLTVKSSVQVTQINFETTFVETTLDFKQGQ